MKPTEPPASSAQSTDAWDRAAASNELDAPLRLKNDADVVAAVVVTGSEVEEVVA